MEKYTVELKRQNPITIEADGYVVQGEFMNFHSEEHGTVHTVRADLVNSVKMERKGN